MSNNTAPEGICPNCWGKQEYGGKYQQMVEDERIDVKNHKKKDAFVKNFIVNFAQGITLKREENGNGYVCPKCKTKYKEVVR